MDVVVSRSLVVVIGGVLFVAGSAKLARHSYFLASILSWSAFTPRQARALSWALPEFEVLLGSWSIGQVLMQGRPYLAALAGIQAALFVGFTGMQVVILRHTAAADCGCLGTRSEMGAASLGRSGLLALAAAAALIVAVI